MNLKNQTQGKYVLATLALCVGLGMAGSAMAQYAPQPNVITTQGHAEVKVRPDSLSVNVTVETKNANLVNAREENNKKSQTIIAALKGLNIPGLKLETQGLNVYPVQDYQNNKLPKVVGYQVNNGVNVTVTGAQADALSTYGSRIVDTALNAGANQVNGLSFFLNDQAPARGQALEQAVKDAQHNAEVMAKAANVTLTGLHSLEGSPQFGNFPRPMAMYSMKARASGAAEADSSAPVEVGETTITSDVTARFKF